MGPLPMDFAQIEARTRATEWHDLFQADFIFLALFGLMVAGWTIFWATRDDVFRRNLFLRLMPMSVCVGILTLWKAVVYLDHTRELFPK